MSHRSAFCKLVAKKIYIYIFFFAVISYSVTDSALKVAKLLSLFFLILVYLYKVMLCSALCKHCWPDLTSICAFRTQRVSSSWPLFIFNACFAFLQPSHSQVTPVPISAPSSLQRTNKRTHYLVLWFFFFFLFLNFGWCYKYRTSSLFFKPTRKYSNLVWSICVKTKWDSIKSRFVRRCDQIVAKKKVLSAESRNANIYIFTKERRTTC